ncbi:MAG: Gfo/Idh/MocA family oxidoreductase [Chloroflexota bacterium]|nr:Gfo/Idh/MocA family oxidoreductase [Chloroflexota bacterium]
MTDGRRETIRWGILSTGNIAGTFAADLALLPDAELIAVGSRSQESADVFGERYNVPHRHASYEALAEDPDVDVIYVGTPHVFHAENTALCLRAGKAVLCEKPLTVNANEARMLINLAREKQVFLMEAMWTRFLPLFVRLRELLEEGVLGEVRMVLADFGFRTEFDPESRLFAPELGGGALLDIGVYPISFASMVLGAPARINGIAHLGETEVDEQSGIVLGYDDGQIATLSTSFQVNLPVAAHVLGTEGRVTIHSPWFHSTRMTLQVGVEEEEIEEPFEGGGYQYEAAEVARCLRTGRLESPIMPLAESLSIMKTMDTLRAQWGVEYPTEA